MKRKYIFWGFLTFILSGAPLVQALDPVAPRAFRKFGMLYVKTPSTTDKVTYTNQQTGESKSLKPAEVEVIPVGKYTIHVTMQDYTYQQDVSVDSTERTDVVVPGYGNIQVNSPLPNTTVEAYQHNSKNLVAKFKANEIKTLPRGHYDIKVKVRNFVIPKDNVYIFTNTTRQLDVIPAEQKAAQST